MSWKDRVPFEKGDLLVVDLEGANRLTGTGNVRVCTANQLEVQFELASTGPASALNGRIWLETSTSAGSNRALVSYRQGQSPEQTFDDPNVVVTPLNDGSGGFELTTSMPFAGQKKLVLKRLTDQLIVTADSVTAHVRKEPPARWMIYRPVILALGLLVMLLPLSHGLINRTPETPDHWDGSRKVFVGAKTAVPEEGFKSLSVVDGYKTAPDVYRDAAGVITAFTLRERGKVTLCFSRTETCGADSTRVTVLAIKERWPAAVAFIGAIVFAFGLVLVFSGVKNPERPWYWLFIEPGPQGGLSLSTFQLAVWFFAAIGIFAALSIPLHRFPELTPTFLGLLGLALLTKVLGGEASPDTVKNGDAATAPTPKVTDLVTDAEGTPQFTRYQQLVVSTLGALVLVLAFADTLSIPDVPKELLYLVGLSQSAYLVPKAMANK